MKRIYLLTALLLMKCYGYSQDHIKTTDGKDYWATITTKTKEDLEINVNGRILHLPMNDVVLIEYKEKGLELFKPDYLQKVMPQAFDGDLNNFLAKNKRVFIPFFGKEEERRAGAKLLRKLVTNDGQWTVVNCDEEADFILEFIYSEEGRDYAYLVFKDRLGNNVMRTNDVHTSKSGHTEAGEALARKLNETYLQRGIYKHIGCLDKRAEKIKRSKGKYVDCEYVLNHTSDPFYFY